MSEKLEKQDQEYILSVSQFAKLCGTTRDTLRFYYEQNIITPRVDPYNGYHYYSPSQISSFFFIHTMRQAGCSIKEISEIIHNSSREKIEKLVNSKILDMQKELYLINKKISALHLGMWILGKYEQHRNGSPFIDEIPEISVSKTIIRDKENAYHTADIAGDISIHLSKATPEASLSSFPSGVTISYDDLIKKHYVYNSITTLSFLPADNIDTFYLPGNLAVCCYQDDSSKDIEKTYKKIVSFIKKNNLKATSDLYVISLINLYEKEKQHTYFKYMLICVEPEA
ncbi:MAG: MerR family transcriptional regulator [Butyrivibrio sp.]|nr:MerR family transcriptional regulator [Butyrivibrio sp.]